MFIHLNQCIPRNVQVDTMDTLHEAMNILKHKGFINYYGGGDYIVAMNDFTY